MTGTRDRAPLAATATRTLALLLAASVLVGCGGDAEPASDGPGRDGSSPAPGAAGSVASGSSTRAPSPSASPGESAASLPPVTDRWSLPALMRDEVRGGRLRRTQQLASTDAWTSWAVTYPVNGAVVSGELLVPSGDGPFPGVVLNHGYIDPAIYTLGRGLSREQEWLAANGFAVLHTDYRGHAASDPVGDVARETRLAYTRDAIAAVRSLRREPFVDGERMGMLGRSMGGAVTQNVLVARPRLLDAAVLFASVSSRFVDNLRQFTEPNRPEGAQAFYERFGRPRESPGFYRGLSARAYFDRVAVPVLAHHGTRDDTTPIRWARETDRLLRRAGADATLATYDDGHAFGPAFAASMRRTVRFLRRELR